MTVDRDRDSQEGIKMTRNKSSRLNEGTVFFSFNFFKRKLAI